SGQQEVANQPIREGLEIASRLSQGEGDRRQETGDRGQATDAATVSNPKSEIQNQKSQSQLGTGLVPASPQVTARQISGPQANAAAAATMAQAMAASMKGQGKGEPGQGQGESEMPREGEASSAAKKGGAAKGGKTGENQKTGKGELEIANTPDADSRGQLGREGGEPTGGTAGRLESEPWFAKLPPGLRAAIIERSRSSATGGYGAGQAPRGYQERLRRYFESVD